MVWRFLPLMLIGVMMFQNCIEGFGVMNQAQLQSLSCGDAVPCDGLGYPLGKVTIEQLSPGDYPSGSYAPAQIESRVLQSSSAQSATTKIALVWFKELPVGFACAQTWLRGSSAEINGAIATELLAGVENAPCRLGEGIPQVDEGLDFLINSGCFFVETNFTVLQHASTGATDLTIQGTAVMDPDFTRARLPTARVRFRCELPMTTAKK